MLAFVPPQQAIAENRNMDHGPKDWVMIERESRVLELLAAKGCLRQSGDDKR